MNKPIVVIHKDGKEEEFPSATSAAVVMNISPSTVRLRLRNGEPFLWNGDELRFRFKQEILSNNREIQ